MPKKHYPLPKRFSVALSERAYIKLRDLNGLYGLSNNYILTVLLENLDDFADVDGILRAFQGFIEEYGTPELGGMRKEEK